MKNTMMTRMTAGAAMSGALLLFGGAAVAAAQPEDGKVDLSIGTAGVLTDVPVTTAAQIAADLCKTDLGEVTVTAESVDTAGAQQSACTNATVGQVDFRQNGQQPGEATTPATPAPAAPRARHSPGGPAPARIRHRCTGSGTSAFARFRRARPAV